MANRDPAHRYTDAEIVKLNSRLHEVYSEAYRDLDKKLKDFNERYRVKEAKYYKDLQDGKITQEQYNNWVKGQVFQGQRWRAKKDDIARTMYNSNTVAANIVNGSTSNVFIQNGNYIGYALEHGAGVSFGFSLYDQNTVSRLLVSDPQLLPEWKINEPKDYAWNYKNVQNSILQGTIQGERLDQISNRIAKGLAMRNENTAKTFARTAMTGAQNAGRQTRLQEAVNKGLNVKKQWMATLDSHTRDSHADVDGEVVGVNEKFSNGLEYPGEPGGAPAEVYNCRCTMVGNLVDYPSFYSRRDNENGKILNKIGPDTVANLSYRDWVTTKSVMEKATSAEEIEGISRTLLEASKLGSGTVDYQVGDDRTSLDFKYKGFDSLFRKITTKSASKGISKEEYAQRITDALRFTNLSPAETLTDDYFKMVDHLESKGYKMVEVTNTFVNYVSYRGINTLVQSPKGYTFELQFHTPQSMEIKEINHKLYEEERKLDKVKDADKIKKIIAEENKNAKSIPTPANVEKIKNI